MEIDTFRKENREFEERIKEFVECKISNIDAKVDTKGLQIGTGFGGDNNNVNVNLAQGFDGNTNVNIEGKKQLNKYLDLTGSADTSGNYRAGIGFDFKF